MLDFILELPRHQQYFLGVLVFGMGPGVLGYRSCLRDMLNTEERKNPKLEHQALASLGGAFFWVIGGGLWPLWVTGGLLAIVATGLSMLVLVPLNKGVDKSILCWQKGGHLAKALDDEA